MKRVKWMRLSGGLLVLTLITSCFVGGTFAKYVTKGEAADSARVAKWGVKVEVTGDGFKTTYDGDSEAGAALGNTVISSNMTENVVAPGTDGKFGGIKITGQPEVAVDITTEAAVDLSGWNVDDGGAFYCPLVFKVGNGSTGYKTICGLHYSGYYGSGQDAFEDAIEAAIEEATTQQVGAGTDLSTLANSIEYSWAWPFVETKHAEVGCDQDDSDDTTSFHTMQQKDDLDTKLGDNAADGDTSNDPKVEITVTTTVTQID